MCGKGGDVQERLEGDVSENGMESKIYCMWLLCDAENISIYFKKLLSVEADYIEHIIHDVLCFLPLTCPLNVLVQE